MKLLDVSLNVDSLDVLAERMLRLDGAGLSALATSAVNNVALKHYDAATDKTLADLNLPRDYITSKIALHEATGQQAKPVAKVTSPIRETTLARFDAQQHEKPVTWSNARIAEMGKSFGPWPGWTRRRGDAKRGIPEDYKADGVDVTVRPGATREMRGAFFMPLRSQGGYQGVFLRKNGRLEHLYGPAVYQVFRNYLSDQEDNIRSDLTEEFGSLLDKAIKELL